VELIDQVLWEQELTDHLKESGPEPEQFSLPASAESPTEPDLGSAPEAEFQPAPVVTEAASAPSPLPSFALVVLWVVVLMVVSGAGWAIGWFML
jgi:hypothetical protein